MSTSCRSTTFQNYSASHCSRSKTRSRHLTASRPSVRPLLVLFVVIIISAFILSIVHVSVFNVLPLSLYMMLVLCVRVACFSHVHHGSSCPISLLRRNRRLCTQYQYRHISSLKHICSHLCRERSNKNRAQEDCISSYEGAMELVSKVQWLRPVSPY